MAGGDHGRDYRRSTGYPGYQDFRHGDYYTGQARHDDRERDRDRMTHHQYTRTHEHSHRSPPGRPGPHTYGSDRNTQPFSPPHDRYLSPDRTEHRYPQERSPSYRGGREDNYGARRYDRELLPLTTRDHQSYHHRDSSRDGGWPSYTERRGSAGGHSGGGGYHSRDPSPPHGYHNSRGVDTGSHHTGRLSDPGRRATDRADRADASLASPGGAARGGFGGSMGRSLSHGELGGGDRGGSSGRRPYDDVPTSRKESAFDLPPGSSARKGYPSDAPAPLSSTGSQARKDMYFDAAPIHTGTGRTPKEPYFNTATVRDTSTSGTPGSASHRAGAGSDTPRDKAPLLSSPTAGSSRMLSHSSLPGKQFWDPAPITAVVAPVTAGLIAALKDPNRQPAIAAAPRATATAAPTPAAGDSTPKDPAAAAEVPPRTSTGSAWFDADMPDAQAAPASTDKAAVPEQATGAGWTGVPADGAGGQDMPCTSPAGTLPPHLRSATVTATPAPPAGPEQQQEANTDEPDQPAAEPGVNSTPADTATVAEVQPTVAHQSPVAQPTVAHQSPVAQPTDSAAADTQPEEAPTMAHQSPVAQPTDSAAADTQPEEEPPVAMEGVVEARDSKPVEPSSALSGSTGQPSAGATGSELVSDEPQPEAPQQQEAKEAQSQPAVEVPEAPQSGRQEEPVEPAVDQPMQDTTTLQRKSSDGGLAALLPASSTPAKPAVPAPSFPATSPWGTPLPQPQPQQTQQQRRKFGAGILRRGSLVPRGREGDGGGEGDAGGAAGVGDRHAGGETQAGGDRRVVGSDDGSGAGEHHVDRVTSSEQPVQTFTGQVETGVGNGVADTAMQEEGSGGGAAQTATAAAATTTEPAADAEMQDAAAAVQAEAEAELPTTAEVRSQLDSVEVKLTELTNNLQALLANQSKVESQLQDLDKQLCDLNEEIQGVTSEDEDEDVSCSSVTEVLSSESSEDGAADEEPQGPAEEEEQAEQVAVPPGKGKGKRTAVPSSSDESDSEASHVSSESPSSDSDSSLEPERGRGGGWRGRGRGRGRWGRGRGRGGAAASRAAAAERAAAERAAAEAGESDAGSGAGSGGGGGSSSESESGGVMLTREDVVASMQLSSGMTVQRMLQGSQQVAGSNHEQILKLLSDDLAEEVRESLTSRTPLEPVITEEFVQDTVDKQLEQFEVSREGMLRYLRDRKQIMKLKEKALADKFKEGTELIKAEVAAGKRLGAPAPPPPTPQGRAGSTRSSASVGMLSFARSDLEEKTLIGNLEAVELLEHQTVLPAQMLDPWERRWKAFDDRNRFCSDPKKELEEQSAAEHWNSEERKVFIDLFLQHPKEFEKIAQQLPGRTAGDCVAFFYKNQKTEEFAMVRKKQQLRKRKMNCEAKRQTMMMMISPALARARGLQYPPPGVQGSGTGGPGSRQSLPFEYAYPYAQAPSQPGSRGNRGRGRGAARAASTGTGTGLPGPTSSSQLPGLTPTMSLSALNGSASLPPLSTTLPLRSPDFPAQSPSSLSLPPLWPSGAAAGDSGLGGLDTVRGFIGIAGGGMGTVTPGGPGWSDEVFVAAVRRHGRDFRTIARVLNLKSESSAKQYYYKHRYRLDLDGAVSEYSAQHGGGGEGRVGLGEDGLQAVETLDGEGVAMTEGGQAVPGHAANLGAGFHGAALGVQGPVAGVQGAAAASAEEGGAAGTGTVATGISNPTVLPPARVVRPGRPNPAPVITLQDHIQQLQTIAAQQQALPSVGHATQPQTVGSMAAALQQSVQQSVQQQQQQQQVLALLQQSASHPQAPATQPSQAATQITLSQLMPRPLGLMQVTAGGTLQPQQQPQQQVASVFLGQNQILQLQYLLQQQQQQQQNMQVVQALLRVQQQQQQQQAQAPQQPPPGTAMGAPTPMFIDAAGSILQLNTPGFARPLTTAFLTPTGIATLPGGQSVVQLPGGTLLAPSAVTAAPALARNSNDAGLAAAAGDAARSKGRPREETESMLSGGASAVGSGLQTGGPDDDTRPVKRQAVGDGPGQQQGPTSAQERVGLRLLPHLASASAVQAQALAQTQAPPSAGTPDPSGAQIQTQQQPSVLPSATIQLALQQAAGQQGRPGQHTMLQASPQMVFTMRPDGNGGMLAVPAGLQQVGLLQQLSRQQQPMPQLGPQDQLLPVMTGVRPPHTLAATQLSFAPTATTNTQAPELTPGTITIPTLARSVILPAAMAHVPVVTAAGTAPAATAASSAGAQPDPAAGGVSGAHLAQLNPETQKVVGVLNDMQRAENTPGGLPMLLLQESLRGATATAAGLAAGTSQLGQPAAPGEQLTAPAPATGQSVTAALISALPVLPQDVPLPRASREPSPIRLFMPAAPPAPTHTPSSAQVVTATPEAAPGAPGGQLGDAMDTDTPTVQQAGAVQGPGVEVKAEVTMTGGAEAQKDSGVRGGVAEDPVDGPAPVTAPAPVAAGEVAAAALGEGDVAMDGMQEVKEEKGN